jgi:hypothetical protein
MDKHRWIRRQTARWSHKLPFIFQNKESRLKIDVQETVWRCGMNSSRLGKDTVMNLQVLLNASILLNRWTTISFTRLLHEVSSQAYTPLVEGRYIHIVVTVRSNFGFLSHVSLKRVLKTAVSFILFSRNSHEEDGIKPPYNLTTVSVGDCTPIEYLPTDLRSKWCFVHFHSSMVHVHLTQIRNLSSSLLFRSPCAELLRQKWVLTIHNAEQVYSWQSYLEIDGYFYLSLVIH